jgi:Ca2+-binding RTX toxin-like protein
MLDGGVENDTLFGENGADRLFGDWGADELQGGYGNDRLSGEGDKDRLFGQTGDDILWGGAGDDILLGFTASNDSKHTLNAGETDNDILYGGDGVDNLYGDLGNDALDGGNGDDLLSGEDGDDRLFGGDGKDQLQGGYNNDRLLGEAGDDRLFGQVGNDILWGDVGNDILVGFTAANESKQSLVAGETDTDLLYGGDGQDLLMGGLGDDQLYGENGDDELQAGIGNDKLYGAAGDDRMFGQLGNDVLYGGDGDDILLGFTASNEAKQSLNAGESDNDWLYGGAGKDYLLGGEGSDYLDGGAGADEMQGGVGSDFYIVNSVNDSILEQSNAGYDIVISSANYLLNKNIEELRLLEGFDIHGTGNALNNKIIGNNRSNILDGVTGQDIMIGEKGNDTYYVDNSGDQVVEQGGEGADRVQSSISYTLGANVEDLVLLDFSKPEQGSVDAVDVLVYGYPKMNELDYIQGDAVENYLGTCALTAISNLLTQADKPTSEEEVVKIFIQNYWQPSDVDKPSYELGGSTPSQQQAILSSYGLRNDLLSGYNVQGLANLVMSGRGVILGVNAGKLWGEDAYNGSGTIKVNHAVTVTGVVYNESDGSLKGFYIADSGRHKVSDMTRFVDMDVFNAAANVGFAYAIYTLEPVKLWNENINGTGNDANNVIIGNRGDNSLYGRGGNDSLSGGAGNDILSGDLGVDTMIGGEGKDTFIVDNAADKVTENTGEGTDLVKSSVTYTLAANTEDLLLIGTDDINGTGNALANTLIGNSADNILNGAAGIDKLVGGVGDDTYFVDSALDTVIENSAAGIDLVSSNVTYALGANVENLTLNGSNAINGVGNTLGNTIQGNNAANNIDGGIGSDVLIGGLGNDRLTGGSGMDAFRFNTALTANMDIITDFTVTDDTIQLENAIFTKLSATGVLNASWFVKAAAASDLLDFVIYNPSTGAMIYDSDGSGAGAGVQIAQLGVNLALTNADFVVI